MLLVFEIEKLSPADASGGVLQFVASKSAGTMTDWFSCNDCNRAFSLLNDKGPKCPSCGSSNGELLTREQMKKGVDAGAYFTIDLTTGKGSKKKPR